LDEVWVKRGGSFHAIGRQQQRHAYCTYRYTHCTDRYAYTQAHMKYSYLNTCIDIHNYLLDALTQLDSIQMDTRTHDDMTQTDSMDGSMDISIDGCVSGNVEIYISECCECV